MKKTLLTLMASAACALAQDYNYDPSCVTTFEGAMRHQQQFFRQMEVDSARRQQEYQLERIESQQRQILEQMERLENQ